MDIHPDASRRCMDGFVRVRTERRSRRTVPRRTSVVDVERSLMEVRRVEPRMRNHGREAFDVGSRPTPIERGTNRSVPERRFHSRCHGAFLLLRHRNGLSPSRSLIRSLDFHGRGETTRKRWKRRRSGILEVEKKIVSPLHPSACPCIFIERMGWGSAIASIVPFLVSEPSSQGGRIRTGSRDGKHPLRKDPNETEPVQFASHDHLVGRIPFLPEAVQSSKWASVLERCSFLACRTSHDHRRMARHGSRGIAFCASSGWNGDVDGNKGFP